METVVTGNLKMMDRLLDSRKVTVTEKDAVKSEEALIAYINQSDYGRWIINSYAHLSDTDKVTFRKGNKMKCFPTLLTGNYSYHTSNIP